MMGYLARILVGDMKPRFKRVCFRIHTEYQWGCGWTRNGANASFEKAMARAFADAEWAVTFPTKGSGSCVTVRKFGQYLYLHPMEVTGYLLPDCISEVAEILASIDKEIVFGVDEVRLDDDVYALSDADVVLLFTEHKREIWDAIAPKIAQVDPKQLRGYVFDELLEDAVIPRNNESCGGVLSSNMVEYAMLCNEATTLLTIWKLYAKP